MQLRPETVEQLTLRYLRMYWRYTGERRGAVLEVLQWLITRIPGTMTENLFYELLEKRIEKACRNRGLTSLEGGDDDA